MEKNKTYNFQLLKDAILAKVMDQNQVQALTDVLTVEVVEE